jgi:hypothetical protein
MDLIAIRSFRDPKAKITVENQQAKGHVHKGAQFTIGEFKTLKELTKHDQPTAEFVALLLLTGCVEPATPEAIARVELELEQDRKREAHAADANTRAASVAVGAQLQDLLVQAAQLTLAAPRTMPARAR